MAHGRHHHVPETAGMDDLRQSKGHEVDLRGTCPLDVKAQAREDSDLALWKEWADSDERRELLQRPLLEPMVFANKRTPRNPQETPAIRAASNVIEAGRWAQKIANKARASEYPFCLKCEPAVFGLSKASIVGLPSLS